MFAGWGKSKYTGKAGLALTADGIAYAGLASGDQLPLLRSCGFTAAEKKVALTQLQTLATHEHLKDCQLGVCLDSSRFNLSLVDAPTVGRDELLQALTWKIKDIIDFPLNELILDYVDVPPTKSAGEMVYAVTSHEAAIQKIVDQTSVREGALERIDIPALALQNILSRLPQAEEGVALLNLMQHDSLLTLGREEKLYLSRGVDIRSVHLRDMEIRVDRSRAMTLFDNLLLDVQRSLDYYDSFFVDPPIRHLLVPTADHAFDELIDYLDQNLSIDVDGFTLDELVVSEENLSIDPEYLGEVMLAVGTALWQTGHAA